jgi:hypothetical protein
MPLLSSEICHGGRRLVGKIGKSFGLKFEIDVVESDGSSRTENLLNDSCEESRNH